MVHVQNGAQQHFKDRQQSRSNLFFPLITSRSPTKTYFPIRIKEKCEERKIILSESQSDGGN